MKTSITLRLSAVIASFCTTYVLFSTVVSLAELPKVSAGIHLAQARASVTR